MSFKNVFSRSGGDKVSGAVSAARPEVRQRTSSMSGSRPRKDPDDMRQERKPLPDPPGKEITSRSKKRSSRTDFEEPEATGSSEPTEFRPRQYVLPRTEIEIRALINQLQDKDQQLYEDDIEIQLLKTKTEELERVVREWDKALNYPSDRESDNNEIRKLRQENAALDGQLKRTQQIPRKPKRHRTRELEEELEKRDGRITELQNILNTIQQQSLQSSVEARWKPMSESAISQELFSIQTNIDGFAREYCGKEALDSKPGFDELISGLYSQLSRFWRIPEDSNVAHAISRTPRGTQRALTGLLSSSITDHLIADPFFFINQDLVKALRPEWHMENASPAYLTFLWSAAAEVDQARAHTWRSDSLRLFNPPEPGELSKRMHSACKESKKSSCLRLARQFQEGPAQLLMKTSPDPTARLRELEDIFLQAAALSTRLWTQRTTFELIGLSWLVNTPFAADSAVMRPHEAHKLESTADTRLDGSMVQIVLHPAVKVRGTHDGEAYDSARVLCKAVVWLEEATGSS